MNLFAELKTAVNDGVAHGELPAFLQTPLLAVAATPQRFSGQESLIRELISQIRDFDPYAGAGCFGGGAGVEDIRRTLARLEERTAPGAAKR